MTAEDPLDRTPGDRRRAMPRLAVLIGTALAGYLLLWGITTAVIMTMVSGARAHGSRPAPHVPGVANFARVDGHLARGAAPSADGYRALSAIGVHTVVDLRAERLSPTELSRPERAGLRVVRIPMRDGQAPTAAQVERFLGAVQDANGQVFVHCGAGVGRTGSMAAAYLVHTGGASAAEALHRSLAIGPPSLEQVTFMRGLATGRPQPPWEVRALSRVADSPRRTWARLSS